MAINFKNPLPKTAQVAETESAESMQEPEQAASSKPAQKAGPQKKPLVAAMEAKGELAAIMKQLVKEKGEGVLIKGSLVPMVQRIPTGLFEFDLATGGGFPMSRLSIIYGPESSGKSNICYLAVASAQQLPAPCNKVVWVDLEGTFDPKWVKQFGVDVDELVVVKPGYGEEAVDIIDAVVRAEDVALVVVDSIAVLTSAKEAEQSTEKFDVGTASVLVKRLSNKLAIAFSLEGRRGHTPAVIFVNQTRFKIGVMFGDPETMPGGQTMKFLSSMTVRLYGKNKIVKEIHPELPAFKETVAVIKKAKVPINASSFKYDMAMMPTDVLKVGESDSWGIVAGHLRAHNLLGKADKGGGWQLEVSPGKKIDYGTLIQIQDHYQTDPQFQKEMKSLVISLVSQSAFLVEAEGLAAK